MLYANNWTALYSIAGINRLGIFIFSALLIACQENAAKIFKAIFVSMLVAGIIAAVVGIMQQYNLLYLWFSESHHQGRLQSLFAHPNVFAMYMTITIPFILYGFLRGGLSWKRMFLLFFVIVICEIAIVFSGCRASWLVYPLTLFFCGLCVYWQKNGGLNWKLDRRLSVGVVIAFPLTVLLCILIIFSLDNLKNIRSPNDISEMRRQVVSTNVIKKRFAEIMSPTVRTKIGAETLYVIKEAPVFGLGFESYGWHISILSQIPQSDFSKNRKQPQLWGSPHSLYLTFLVNGGIVGILLWITLVIVVCNFLITDVSVNKTTDSLPVFLSIVAFHLYGLAESIQVTPVIWFTIFLCIAYATTIGENILPNHQLVFWQRWSAVCGVLVLLGGVSYATNFQSWRLAEKYGLPRYSPLNNPDQIYYSGFYTPNESPIGMTRWMGKRGSIEITQDGVMEFNIVCQHPDIQEEPVTVTIDVSGKVIDEVVFFAKSIKKRQYYFSKTAVGRRLNICVSRTWNPQKFSGTWSRIQGVAVSAPQYFSEIPENGTGFSVWERMIGRTPEWSQSDQQYRWSGKRATIRIDEKMQKQGFEIYLRSRHPDVFQKPVEVQLFADEVLVDTIVLSSSNWQLLSIGQEKLIGKKTFTLDVSRTWNPQLMGISTDNRDLGVAVVLP